MKKLKPRALREGIELTETEPAENEFADNRNNHSIWLADGDRLARVIEIRDHVTPDTDNKDRDMNHTLKPQQEA